MPPEDLHRPLPKVDHGAVHRWLMRQDDRLTASMCIRLINEALAAREILTVEGTYAVNPQDMAKSEARRGYKGLRRANDLEAS